MLGLKGEDIALTGLLQEADRLPDAIFGVVNFSTESVVYAGNQLKDWIGLEPEDFRSDGIRKAVSIVDPGQLLPLALMFAASAQQARAVNFDPRSVRYIDLAWTAVTPRGRQSLLFTSVVLNYTPSRNIGWTVAFLVRETDDSLEVLTGCKRLLRAIKERYNLVYTHPSADPAANVGPIQFANPLIDRITSRELEVLRLLARGFSTSEAATCLSIAKNTVETHRKKLLEKFEARNVAELINKASKVYWLE